MTKHTPEELAQNKIIAARFGLLKTNCRNPIIVDFKTANTMLSMGYRGERYPGFDEVEMKEQGYTGVKVWWTGKSFRMNQCMNRC